MAFTTGMRAPAKQALASKSGSKAFTAVRPCAKASRAAAVAVRAEAPRAEGAAGLEVGRRTLLSGATMAALAGAVSLPAPAQAGRVISGDWEQVELPIDKGVVLLDLAMVDANHGFLLGTRQTLLETFDGGKTWAARAVEVAQDEGFNYRFTSISFAGQEGWVVGKPAILLHTADGGKNWERVPLSTKLPGTPVLITAIPGKAGQAEMTTDVGAIYVTDNTAYTWTGAVQESVDATLNRTVSSGISGASYYEGYFSNVARNAGGDYVAVSSRGNFYMTWSPGQTFWQPHNRPAARRVQNMGWTPAGQLWLSTRGGDVLLSADAGESGEFEEAKLSSRGFGILDVGFKNEKQAFACGGSGSLYRSEDGGKSWKRDKDTDDVAGNLYAIKFFPSGPGFVLGNDAILLRYIGA